jgi:hypothetical protein
MFSVNCSYCNTPSSPELCGLIDYSGNGLKKLGESLGISKRSIQDALFNLVRKHLLTKISDETGRYIVNPNLAARGKAKATPHN